MNEFEPYIPSFASVATMPAPQNFETMEDLLNIDIIKLTTKIRGFSRFALSGYFLVTIMGDGSDWWVVGRIKDPSSVAFPQWDGGNASNALDSSAINQAAFTRGERQ